MLFEYAHLPNISDKLVFVTIYLMSFVQNGLAITNIPFEFVMDRVFFAIWKWKARSKY